jgi:hypothetical protein
MATPIPVDQESLAAIISAVGDLATAVTTLIQSKAADTAQIASVTAQFNESVAVIESLSAGNSSVNESLPGLLSTLNTLKEQAIAAIPAEPVPV